MVVADGKGVPLGIAITSASPSEVKLAEPTLATIAVPQRGRGRPRCRMVRLIADRAYDSDPLRRALPRRKLDLFAVDAADPRLPQPDFSATEDEASLVVPVPERSAIGIRLVPRPAEGGAILLKQLGKHLHAVHQDELAKSLTGVQEDLREPRLGRRRRPPRGTNAFRRTGLRAILLHGGGLLFDKQPDDVIGPETAVNFQRSEGHRLLGRGWCLHRLHAEE
jgi:hypothetical protein